MSFHRKNLASFFVLAFTVALVLGFVSRMSLQAYAQPDESAKLAEAENAVLEAFLAVHSAQDQGGNVTDLVVRLNAAGELLAAANIAFRSGDYYNASLLADECMVEVDGIVNDAVALKSEVESAGIDMMNLSILAASVGLSVLFVAGLLGWRFLKGFYLRRSLRMRPRVVKGN